VNSTTQVKAKAKEGGKSSATAPKVVTLSASVSDTYAW